MEMEFLQQPKSVSSVAVHTLVYEQLFHKQRSSIGDANTRVV